MDLSKLPKLSQTPPSANNAQTAADASDAAPAKVELFCRCGAPITPGTNFCSHCGANYYEAVGSRGASKSNEGGVGLGGGAEAWISIALGVILIFMAPRIWQFYLMPTKFTWSFNDAQGNQIAYPQTEFYWADLGVATFGIMLFAEALLLLIARRTLVIIALVLTAAVTALNLYVIVRTFSVLGFQIVNALAVAFGMYIVFYELALLKSMQKTAR